MTATKKKLKVSGENGVVLNDTMHCSIQRLTSLTSATEHGCQTGSGV